MDYRRLIPNMCTSSNLVFGMCSILSTYSGNLVWGSIFILLALVADGLAGRTAGCPQSAGALLRRGQ